MKTAQIDLFSDSTELEGQKAEDWMLRFLTSKWTASKGDTFAITQSELEKSIDGVMSAQTMWISLYNLEKEGKIKRKQKHDAEANVFEITMICKPF